MRLGRVVLEAVLAAVLAAGRGWFMLLFHPFASAWLLATLPVNTWLVIDKLPEMFRTGLVVETPHGQDWILRTVVLGFGDVTTRVRDVKAVTPEQVSVHFESSKQKMQPLAATLEALARASALVMVSLSLYVNRDTFVETGAWWPVALTALTAFGRAFTVSLLWTLGVHVSVYFVALGVRRLLDRRP